jgi:hypothetical protein
MKKILLFLFALSGVFVFVGAGCTYLTVTTSNTTTQTPAAGNFQNDIFGFTYPSDIFSASSTGNMVDLISPYYVVENYKGTPDAEYQHPFVIHFEYQKLPILEAIKNTPSMGTSFMSSFPKKTLDSFMDDGDYATNFVAGGKNGYAFTVGIEGANAKYIYVPISDTETLFIQMTYFTDFLKNNVKPTTFSEEQEMKAFSSIMDSLKFRIWGKAL